MPAPERLVFAIGMTTRFRGIVVREGMLLRGAQGWAEWSPFTEYGIQEAAHWLRAALEAAELPPPVPLRTSVPVNVTVPVVEPGRAARIVADSGCRTAKVKVADPGTTLDADLDRVAAVREALGVHGRIRIDANGAWTLAEAFDAVARFARYDIEYVEQPCRSTEDLARLRVRLARNGIDVRVAADESLRRSDDPERVRLLAAADVAVLKVQPMGGVRACLELADRLGLQVVVSSALETSIGLFDGLTLAAALPQAPLDCGLNTARLLTGDLVDRPLTAVGGAIQVRRPVLDPELAARWAAPPDRADWWEQRFQAAWRLVGRP